MFSHQSRRDWLKTVVVSAAGAAGLARAGTAQEAAAPAPAPQGAPPWPFYAMDTGLRGPDVPTVEARVGLLKELGYAGIEYTLGGRQLPQVLEQLDKHALQLWGVYTTPSLEGGLAADLEESVKLMKGRPTRIELCINSKEFKPSDPAGDAKAADLLKRASDMAGDTGPVVSVYPHRGSWTERVEDGMRLGAQVNRPNVGTNFNLVHWKWVGSAKPLEALLAEALPHLKAVTINGLAGDKIVPLDEGDYDVAGFVAVLKKVGYRGPVGFQGYGIKGPSQEFLKRTMEKWREILAKLST